MTYGFKSPTQPHCRSCGRPIRKLTTTVWFGAQAPHADAFSISRTEKPATLDEARRLVNQQVVSHQWRGDREWIHRMGLWDGESYQDEFFCTGECAKRLGYAAARPPFELVLKPYSAAIRRRDA